jgi:hypothetical protein
MVYSQTKNPNFGLIWEGLGIKKVRYSMAIWNILWPFGICYSHLVIKWQFGIFSAVLVHYIKKNLATLLTAAFKCSSAAAKQDLRFSGRSPTSRSGLPDFSWYKIPKRKKYTKLP